MTDRQRYKRTFSLLHASDSCFMEVRKMKQTRHMPVRRLISVCTAAVLITIMAAAAYAADVGGIQRTIQLWIHGDQTNATLEVENGSYHLTYTDGDGKTRQISGGGVVIDDDGEERPLTEEDIMDTLDLPEVEYREDGSVWVYYRSQQLEITDRFEDGVCYVQLKGSGDVLYMTVEYQGRYIVSPHGYEKL